MPTIDDHITTYLAAIEVEGKTLKTRQSYANSLADFRKIGRVPGSRTSTRIASATRSPPGRSSQVPGRSTSRCCSATAT